MSARPWLHARCRLALLLAARWRSATVGAFVARLQALMLADRLLALAAWIFCPLLCTALLPAALLLRCAQGARLRIFACIRVPVVLLHGAAT